MTEETTTVSKLYKYLIGITKELKEKAQIPFKVKKAEKDLEMKVLEVEQAIAEEDVAIEEAKYEYPAKWDTIIDKIDKKELLARKLNQLNTLKAELFGE
jgi:hypothetical protein